MSNTLEQQAALPDEMVRKATEAAYSLNYCTEWAASKIAEAALTAAGVPGLLAEVERLQARVYERGEAIAAAERERDALRAQLAIAESERDEARAALDACVNCFECENTLSNAVIEQARRVLGKVEELGKP